MPRSLVWFLSFAHFEEKSEEKVFIGDSLSSHISLKVLEKGEAENTKFVCLPPNSTHLTQVLDVAHFRPMKITWVNILVEFKFQNIKDTQKHISIAFEL